MSQQPLNLFAQQEANRRRTTWLVVGFLLFFAWLGFGGDWIVHELTRGAPAGAYRHAFPWIGIVLSVVAAGLVWHAWSAASKEILWSVGARELLRATDDRERMLINVTEEMAVAAGVPRPRLWIIADDDPNALATGLGPDSSHIAVTAGLLQLCSRDELQAVVAHEMAHVRNYDVRLMTMLAGLVGAIAVLHDGMMRLMMHGGMRGGRRGGRSSGGSKGGLGPLMLLALVLWIISWLLAPLIARLLALGVSREREFLADASAAQFTRNPAALASALEKIEHAALPTHSITTGAAHLCIADPLGRGTHLRQGALDSMFATHPPMPLRVARLRSMGYQERKRMGDYTPGTSAAVTLG